MPLSTLELVKGCDYMWVDIWEKLYAEEALPITQRLQHQIKAKTVDYWGCELDLITKAKTPFSLMTTSKLKDTARATGLPLSVLSLNGNSLQLYMELCGKALHILFKAYKRRPAA